MSTPVFSIITPTFRRPLLLKRNILSVKNQLFENYEHIIIDDANDSETASIVNEAEDERIIFLRHESPKGAAVSYNTGIKASRGQFILFLDDDDEYLPCILKKVYARFSNSGPNLGFVWTGISKIKDTNNGETLESSIIWPSRFPEKEDGLIAATSIGNGYGVCIRRKCIDTIGCYDETLTFGHDTEFLFRLARNFEFDTIPDILVKIHLHNKGQLTDEKNNLLRLDLREKILQKNIDLLIKYPKLYDVHYKVVADLSYKLKLRGRGRKIMFSIIKKTPFNVLTYTDLIFYETFGKNTVDYYTGSIFKKFVHFLKRKK